ncbi:hypothetical protein AALO_G00222400 [Alosa alosa]|uniref:Kisspeptin n=1 Tax=Alosa alosa TaxID=278164 RepID=A0AAV6G0B3_9TELE|nr:hypothetical protein AALO_G00222400 [Alosa alosa]
MRMHVLLLVSAIICQYGATGTLMQDYEDPEFTTSTQEPAPFKVRRYAGVTRRQTDSSEASEDEALCLLSRERDALIHLSCKQRLTRSNFNINPFGLRFGKRQNLLNTPTVKSEPRKLLPILLYLRDRQIAT